MIRRPVWTEDEGEVWTGPVFARDTRKPVGQASYEFRTHYFRTPEAASKLKDGHGEITEFWVEAKVRVTR